MSCVDMRKDNSEVPLVKRVDTGLLRHWLGGLGSDVYCPPTSNPHTWGATGSVTRLGVGVKWVSAGRVLTAKAPVTQ